MTELLTLTPWPDGETLVEALGGAGGGIKETSPTELGAGGAGGGTLEPSPTELTAEKDCIRIASPRVEVGCEVTTEL